MTRQINQCQTCSTVGFESIVNLGLVPAVNDMKDIGSDTFEQQFYPLELVQCDNCKLVQINYEINPEIVFPETYPYLSGTTEILRKNFEDLAATCIAKKYLGVQDLVVDIGSNDGTLLKSFLKRGCRVLGIEPTQAADVALENGIDTLKSYFDSEIVEHLKSTYGSVKLVTAANVFAHIPDPNNVVRQIKKLMRSDSVFISENHYLKSLVDSLQYDTVYHEHLRYYHLFSLVNLFERHGLEVFDAEMVPTHGGSIRVYTCLKGTFKPSRRFQTMIENEQSLNINSWHEDFINRIQHSRLKLINLLSTLRLEGNSIYGIGAPSRASTLVSYCGLNDSLVSCALEISSSAKINKFMPGTAIPVLDETILFEKQPEYVLLFSWHIADELIPKLKEKGYRGKFIIPLPEVIIKE